MVKSLYSTKHFVSLKNFLFTDSHNFFRISTFNYKQMNDFINENVAKYEHLTKQCNNTLNNQRYELHLIEVKVIIKMPVLLILAHTFTFFRYRCIPKRNET